MVCSSVLHPLTKHIILHNGCIMLINIEVQISKSENRYEPLQVLTNKTSWIVSYS